MFFAPGAEENKELSVGNEIAIVADTQEKLDELQLLPTEAEAGAFDCSRCWCAGFS